MTKLLSVCVGSVCAISLAGCALFKPAPTKGTIGENAVTVTATVEKVDLATRMVTLRGPDGKSVTFRAGEQVKNLPQVKKGDKVVATYYESVAYEVKKPGTASPGVKVAEQAGSAEPGERPAGMGARTVTVTSTVEAIDRQTPTVTLRGPEGNLVTLKVRHPERLKAVKVGDLVEITYTQAVAISVKEAGQ